MNLRCAAALAALLAAAGCGQRGPLYLPGDPNEGRVVLPTEELPGSDQDEDERAGDAEGEPAEDSAQDDEQDPGQ